MAINTSGLLDVKVPQIDLAQSLSEGMALGNQIKAARQSSALNMLMSNPDIYDAKTGQFNMDHVAALAQQSGLASTLLPYIEQRNALAQQARLEDQQSQENLRAAQLKNTTIGSANLSRHLGGYPNNVSPMTLMQGLDGGTEAGLWPQTLADSVKAQMPVNLNNMPDYVQSFRARSADPDQVYENPMPKFQSQRVDGGAQLGSYNRLTDRYTSLATVRDIPEQSDQPSNPIYAGAVVAPSTVAAFAKDNGMTLEQAYALITQSGARFK
ncbi:hypothetical protein [Aquirhabdus parva]|uniref:Uncharacterized protein n=1 Tax=Aquirhabdus parva TaxID=2283318 RepID=A0A345P994_9GAMM|nr:hypothetical protein [Aquirhabdus parva]AXI03853.1 hypothetical protein HYN46_14015 [Aquirhabdus parva]